MLKVLDLAMAPNSKQLDKASGSRLDQIVSKKPVTDDERKEMRRIFEAFDRDGSDSISADELDNILQLLNVRLEKKDLHRLTNCIDANGDGQVTFDEFVKFLSIRVLEPARNIKIIDTKHTIASRLVGGNSKLESWIFYTVVKQRGVCGKLLWIFWYSGLILGLFFSADCGTWRVVEVFQRMWFVNVASAMLCVFSIMHGPYQRAFMAT